ncbi:Protein CBG26342 [Caenorhabditis briggsae]|uniref:Protein CBG26342 n=1 Tax=Caenorhabditis briggsae TaxID=6238 RepID=B6IGB3_CAEBR|nr:Protein CBG26342 [Caenorhabditis briggsae]CAR98943.1 Protein CBG26342 [Caenorhabditis briggsae]
MRKLRKEKPIKLVTTHGNKSTKIVRNQNNIHKRLTNVSDVLNGK